MKVQHNAQWAHCLWLKFLGFAVLQTNNKYLVLGMARPGVCAGPNNGQTNVKMAEENVV